MSKFNTTTTRPAVHAPIQTSTTPTGRTHEGAPGYGHDAKSELFLLAVSNMVGEDTFYEKAGNRDDRFEHLVREVAITDAGWMLNFITWLRSDANMRSASIVAACQAVHVRLAVPKLPAGNVHNETANRAIIAAAMVRADEPGELLAYWTSTFGRAIPKPVKRGVADAVLRLYTERNLLKYDTDSKGFRFGDVVDLVHPTTSAPWQGELFRYALDRRHGRDLDTFGSLTMVAANAQLRWDVNAFPEYLLDADKLQVAGMTWEDALSLAGSKLDKARLWEALIPSMGVMALARNLRNFDQAGVSDEAAAAVCARFADPEQVAKSRMFPFRWLAAYRAAPSLRWGHALEKALTASLANVPELPGRTLVLVDRSGSMFGAVSQKSQLNFADTAAVFGSALALRNVGRVDLVQYGNTAHRIDVKAGDSLLRTVERFSNLGGTYTQRAAREHYRGHDRVVIVTDEQAHDGDAGTVIPANVSLYTWNLVGYRHSASAGKPHRHWFAGLTDQAFQLIPLLEARRDGRWPWM